MTHYFQIDPLSQLIIALVCFIGFNAAWFCRHYFKGDSSLLRFYTVLISLIASVCLMVSANHLLVFLAAWALSNLLLTALMIHQPSWRAARESGLLALKNFILGFICISLALAILSFYTGKMLISELLLIQYPSAVLFPVLGLLLIGAMTQSGLWPMHRWLTSSLNSPSPVSAVMHAGLVNGGGFLLIKFSPLINQLPEFYSVIFIVGIVSVLLGTLWKLIQNDVKRMLACSTMSQMGFMIVQCGLGLFPAALAHLCFHGLFKSYLFLASGSAAQENRLDLGYPPSLGSFALAIFCGSLGAMLFLLASHKSLGFESTETVLVMIALISCAQFSLPILQKKSLKTIFMAVTLTSLAGAFYGFSVHLIEQWVAPMNLMQAQPLNVLHITALLMMVIAWLLILFARDPRKTKPLAPWKIATYVQALNASQPHPKTVTAHRNHYQSV